MFGLSTKTLEKLGIFMIFFLIGLACWANGGTEISDYKVTKLSIMGNTTKCGIFDSFNIELSEAMEDDKISNGEYKDLEIICNAELKKSRLKELKENIPSYPSGPADEKED